MKIKTFMVTENVCFSSANYLDETKIPVQSVNTIHKCQ